MAITRCPYCHAITDETDKYCNNCGTQLLFPEDEEIEEEIPGEKILDAETEEKDYKIDEPEEIDLEDLIEEETVKAAAVEEPGDSGKNDDQEEPKNNEPAEEESREDELDEEAEEQEEEEEEEEEDEVGGEVIVLDEAELAADHESVFPAAEPSSEEGRPAVVEDLPGIGPPPGASAGPVPPTFDTVELEGMGKTVELGKDKVEQLLEAMADAKAPEETAREGTREPTGTLPPWASVMKGAPAFSDVQDTGEIEPKSVETAPWDVGEEEIFPRKKPSDSTIGFPERVTQAALPFEAPAAEEEVEQDAEEELAAREAVEEERIEETVEEERRGFLRTDRREAPPVRETEREDVEAAEEREGPGERPPFNVSAYLKSKAFDVLFVGLFWVVALWLAAHAMGATLFGILAAMSGSMLLLYAVLVLIYFFFFKFFLGETLGERLFRGRP